MVKNKKCAHCKLINWEGAEDCSRCGATLLVSVNRISPKTFEEDSFDLKTSITAFFNNWGFFIIVPGIFFLGVLYVNSQTVSRWIASIPTFSGISSTKPNRPPNKHDLYRSIITSDLKNKLLKKEPNYTRPFSMSDYTPCERAEMDRQSAHQKEINADLRARYENMGKLHATPPPDLPPAPQCTDNPKPIYKTKEIWDCEAYLFDIWNTNTTILDEYETPYNVSCRVTGPNIPNGSSYVFHGKAKLYWKWNFWLIDEDKTTLIFCAKDQQCEVENTKSPRNFE